MGLINIIDHAIKNVIYSMFWWFLDPLEHERLYSQLVDVIEEIAGVKLKRSYNLDAPKGVRGRSSDNTLIKQYLSWEPSIALKDGMKKL